MKYPGSEKRDQSISLMKTLPFCGDSQAGKGLQVDVCRCVLEAPFWKWRKKEPARLRTEKRDDLYLSPLVNMRII